MAQLCRHLGDRGGRLYLIGIQATLERGGEASVATLFPESPDRVFAQWYSGTIRIRQGKLLDYVHMGYESTYDRDLLFEIESGVVIHTTVSHNGSAIADGAEVCSWSDDRFASW